MSQTLAKDRNVTQVVLVEMFMCTVWLSNTLHEQTDHESVWQINCGKPYGLSLPNIAICCFFRAAFERQEEKSDDTVDPLSQQVLTHFGSCTRNGACLCWVIDTRVLTQAFDCFELGVNSGHAGPRPRIGHFLHVSLVLQSRMAIGTPIRHRRKSAV